MKKIIESCFVNSWKNLKDFLFRLEVSSKIVDEKILYISNLINDTVLFMNEFQIQDKVLATKILGSKQHAIDVFNGWIRKFGHEAHNAEEKIKMYISGFSEISHIDEKKLFADFKSELEENREIIRSNIFSDLIFEANQLLIFHGDKESVAGKIDADQCDIDELMNDPRL